LQLAQAPPFRKDSIYATKRRGILLAHPKSGAGLDNKRSAFTMCDYSLQNVKSRAAKVGDRLTTKNFGAGTRGFAAPEDSSVAVCVLPGTEIAFSAPVKIAVTGLLFDSTRMTASETAIFRQVDKDSPYRHHDALEFPNGEMVLLTNLSEGQDAVVLQLPAQPKTAAEADEQTRAAYSG
jgi:hypothetical protein